MSKGTSASLADQKIQKRAIEREWYTGGWQKYALIVTVVNDEHRPYR